MRAFAADVTCNMSEFKKDPEFVLRKAGSYLVAVLNGSNEPAFYAIEPRLFEAMVAELAESDMHKALISRMKERARAIEVDIDGI